MGILLLNLSILLFVQEGNTIKKSEPVIKPHGYEGNLSILDSMSPINLPLKEDEVIIVISRLGKGEDPTYNKRRLFTVKSYLTKDLKLSENKLIMAVGEPISGYGILEFYIKGKKLHALAADKNEELRITELPGPAPKYYLPKPKVRKK